MQIGVQIPIPGVGTHKKRVDSSARRIGESSNIEKVVLGKARFQPPTGALRADGFAALGDKPVVDHVIAIARARRVHTNRDYIVAMRSSPDNSAVHVPPDPCALDEFEPPALGWSRAMLSESITTPRRLRRPRAPARASLAGYSPQSPRRRVPVSQELGSSCPQSRVPNDSRRA